jgi:myo-inositol-1(or 4)-monophosphatase
VASPYLAAAREAALAAGTLLRERFGRPRASQRKSLHDLVTQDDHDAEALIVAILRERFPRHTILAEEGGEVVGADDEFRWLIDPLDGTINYARGLAHFDVSLALTLHGRVILGLTYAPILDELFWAVDGGGAFVGRRGGEEILRVSDTPRLADALVTTSLPAHAGARKLLHYHTRLVGRSFGQRRPGAAALDMAYVAAGRFDAMIHPDILPWDVAAGLALVREAGGCVTDLSGHAPSPDAGSVVASNGRFHEELLRALHEPWADE